MNYYKIVMKVFKNHNRDFVRIAIKREQLKQMIYAKRRNNEYVSEEKIKSLDKEIKQEIERINKVIGGILNGTANK